VSKKKKKTGVDIISEIRASKNEWTDQRENPSLEVPLQGSRAAACSVQRDNVEGEYEQKIVKRAYG
jgi:hypothetical protein